MTHERDPFECPRCGDFQWYIREVPNNGEVFAVCVSCRIRVPMTHNHQALRDLLNRGEYGRVLQTRLRWMAALGGIKI